MHAKQLTPVLVGSLMGLMMLRMLHGVMTDSSDLAGPVLWAFLLAHVATFALLGALLIWSARYAPKVRVYLDRMHRPSARHVLLMTTSAVGAAFVAHLFVHGGL